MKKIIILLLFICNAISQSAHSQITEFYVSVTKGNDSYPGTQSFPLKTFKKAVEVVRSEIASGMSGDITVYFEEGIYYLDEPIVFLEEDAADSGYKITYRNFEEDDVIMSGGVVINEWEEEGGMYKSTIPDDIVPPTQNIRQLYSDGQKQIRARNPNFNEHFTTHNTQPQLTEKNIRLEKGLLDNVAINNKSVEVCMNIAYSHHRLIIDNIVPDDGYDTYTFKHSHKLFHGYWNGVVAESGESTTDVFKNREFWFENHPDFIDEPGEWHYDRLTKVLSYLPLSGNANNENITIPRLDRLIIFKQDESTVSDYDTIHTDDSNWVDYNIELIGFKFMHTSGRYDISKSGLIDMQANFFQPFPNNGKTIPSQPAYRKDRPIKRIHGAIDAYKANKINIKNCSFVNLGGSGITLDHGGSDCEIIGNFFNEIASSAIEVGTDMDTISTEDVQVVPSNTLISNNYINNVATDYLGGVGILATYVNNIEISNNTIEHVPYVGIHFGWGWDDKCASVDGTGPCLNANNTIKANKVLYACEKLYDCGGIYTNSVNQSSEVTENYVAFTDGHGIYMDRGSAGFTVNNNVLENNHTYNNNEQLGWIKENMTGQNSIFSNSDSSADYNCTLTYLDYVIGESGIESEYMDLLNSQITKLNQNSKESKVVIFADNSDPGYYGFGWQHSGLYGYKNSLSKFSGMNYAYASFKASLAKGYYNIQFYNVVHPESDPDLEVKVHSASGVQSFTINQKIGESGWIDLGNFLINDCEAHVEVERQSSTTNEYSRISAIKFELIADPISTETSNGVYIIDNHDLGYAEDVGDWLTSGITGYNNSTVRYTNTESASVNWYPNIPKGLYEVSIYKIVHQDSDPNATIRIYDDGGQSLSQNIDFSSGNSGWHSLGVHSFSNHDPLNLRVQLIRNSQNSNEYLRADAVRFTLVPPNDDDEYIINITDPNYIESDHNWFDSGLLGNGGSGTRYSSELGAYAKWIPNMTPGTYEVLVYKIVHQSSDPSSTLNTVNTAQMGKNVLDYTTGISGWQSLGEYTFSGNYGDEYIRIIKSNSGYIRTDAVKLSCISGCNSNGRIDPESEAKRLNESDSEYRHIIYPNPSFGIYKISASENLSQVKIYGISGEEYESFKIESTGENNYLLDLKRALQGIYILDITTTTGERSIHRIVVQYD